MSKEYYVYDPPKKKVRCRKHCWIEQIAKFEPILDLRAGGINLLFPSTKVEICMHCRKIRNGK